MIPIHRLGGSGNAPNSQHHNKTQKFRCYRCGDPHHTRDYNKDWRSVFCQKCSRQAHLNIVCSSKVKKKTQNFNGRNNDQPSRSHNTHHFTQHRKYSDDILSLQTTGPNDEIDVAAVIVQVSINGKNITIRSGLWSRKNIISPETFDHLYSASPKPELERSNVEMEAWRQSAALKVMGRFHAVAFEGVTCHFRRCD